MHSPTPNNMLFFAAAASATPGQVGPAGVQVGWVLRKHLRVPLTDAGIELTDQLTWDSRQ